MGAHPTRLERLVRRLVQLLAALALELHEAFVGVKMISRRDKRGRVGMLRACL